MPTPAWERMPAAKRRQLVVTAAEEFAAYGFEQASLNRIIARCGMSKSSFYHVASSKEELLSLTTGELMGAVLKTWTPPAPAEFETDFWARADGLWTELLALAQGNHMLTLLGRIFYLNHEIPQAQQALAAIQGWLHAVLQVGRAGGVINEELPADLQGRMLFAVLRCFDEWTLANQERLSQAELVALSAGQLQALRRLLATD